MVSKFPQMGSSIFSEMSQLAAQYNAINLSQGFPDFPTDDRLKLHLAQAAQSHFHQYVPMAGYGPLLERLATLTETQYGRLINPQHEILVTAGATQGIFAAIQALVHPGDEVIVLDPSYDCYTTPIHLVSAHPVRVPLGADFLPDWPQIEGAVCSRTRMIIINTPHNPSGRVWNSSDYLALQKLVAQHPQLLVLSDEVYEYISFASRPQSVHQYPQLWERCISVSSFGKSFHCTGWKVGYMVASEPLMREIKKVHQFLVFSVNSVAQVALTAYLEEVSVALLGDFYRQKRDYFARLMQTTAFTLLPCEGSYFQLVSWPTAHVESDMKLVRRMVQEVGVAAIPLSPFYEHPPQNQHLRFCFAKSDTTLEQAVERLQKIKF